LAVYSSDGREFLRVLVTGLARLVTVNEWSNARVGPQRLLLADLRSGAQPTAPCACCGQHLRESAQRRLGARLLLVHSFIPQPAAAVPFGFQSRLGLLAGPQPVGVAHGFDNAVYRRNAHAGNLSGATDINSTERRQRRFLPTAEAGGIHAAHVG